MLQRGGRHGASCSPAGGRWHLSCAQSRGVATVAVRGAGGLPAISWFLEGRVGAASGRPLVVVCDAEPLASAGPAEGRGGTAGLHAMADPGPQPALAGTARRAGDRNALGGRYRSTVVEGDEHLLTVVRYIERNPVRAGLSPSCAAWPWSSARARLVGSPALLAPLPVALPEDWLAWMNTPQTAAELDACRRPPVRDSARATELQQSGLVKSW
jgi:hypothetical protein